MNFYYNFYDQANDSEGRAFRTLAEALETDSKERGVNWTVFFNHELNRTPSSHDVQNVDMVIISECGLWICELKSFSEYTMRTDDDLVAKAVNQTISMGRIAKGMVDNALRSLGQKSNEFFRAHLVFAANLKLLNAIHKSDQIIITDLQSLVKELRSASKGKFNSAQIDSIIAQLNRGPVPKVPIKNVRIPRFREFKANSLVKSLSHDFTRIFRAQQIRSGEEVLLFVYDIGYRNDVKDGLALAQRESNVYMHLQKCRSVARIVSQFSQADYPGEIATFAIASMRSERSLEDKRSYSNLNTDERILFTKECLTALTEIHQTKVPSNPNVRVLHRNLSPKSIYISTEGLFPVIYDFALAGLDPNSTVVSIQPSEVLEGSYAPSTYLAPIIREVGLLAASDRTDNYAMAKILLDTVLKQGTETGDEKLELARMALQQLCNDATYQDANIDLVIKDLSALAEAKSSPAPPSYINDPVDLWDNGTVVALKSKPSQRYKIVARLGHGSEYISFRANAETEKASIQRSVVLRVPHHASQDSRSLTAYRKASLLDIEGLQRINEVEEHQDPSAVAVISSYVDGFPLIDVPEIWSDIAADAKVSFENLVITWLKFGLKALKELSRQNLVLRDVSQQNIIVNNKSATFIDLSAIDDSPSIPDHLTPANYILREDSDGTYLPVDDFNSFISSYKKLLDEIFPYLQESTNELTIESAKPKLFALYRSITQSISLTIDSYEACLNQLIVELDEIASAKYEPNNDHLMNLLSFYPGSRFGNSETRGIDEEISRQTYVPTRLDDELYEKVTSGEKNLVILLGNAGDGKTAVLQHLLKEIYGEDRNFNSRDRIFIGELDSNRELYVNFDGSASHKGRSAQELLKELFEPFSKGAQPYTGIRIVAINSGPLYTWVEHNRDEPEFADLAVYIQEYLENGQTNSSSDFDSFTWIVDLNERSLVGSIHKGRNDSSILSEMIKQMVDPINGDDKWDACRECSAQSRCTAFNSVQTLRGQTDKNGDIVVRKIEEIARIVHLRGKFHITTRVLKGWLSFVLFGTYSCKELQSNEELIPSPMAERLFGVVNEVGKAIRYPSETVQGEIFEEVKLLDPGLVPKPILDRGARFEEKIESYRRAEFLYPRFSEIGLTYELSGSIEASLYQKMVRAIVDRDHSAIQYFLKLLLEGLARIDDLPSKAFRDQRYIPLRIDTVNPIELVIWSEIAIDEFDLSLGNMADVQSDSSLEKLPNKVILRHRYSDRSTTSTLTVDLETFTNLRNAQRRLHLPPTSGGGGSLTNLRIFLRQLQMHEIKELFVLDNEDSEKVFKVSTQLKNEVTQLKMVEV
ncbi:serine/threonine-protein kinase [Acidithrix sp. C25]|uniref:serine/threonine-protein kinase n=1 Tax=Acidithrix sp. C25 TaxID=1671482 RepID=UPI00191BBFF7|nr:serine/threonine-protein kinase [Acidithrix sp. C25]CAG4907804.1 unnamed protein product [Acidithrix sp. C25]